MSGTVSFQLAAYGNGRAFMSNTRRLTGPLRNPFGVDTRWESLPRVAPRGATLG